MNNYIAIAIDGPAGAGKTTQAKALANELGFTYVDTGALYRAFAVQKLWMEKELGTEVSVGTVLNTFDLEFTRDENGDQRVMVCGKDVTDYLRTSEVSMVASTTSAFPEVREALLSVQKKQALCQNVVMEGRDIGTVVLPDAQVKFFLFADVNTRAKRRVKELKARGEKVDYIETLEQMIQRDEQDTNREIAPLRPAEGAYMMDCSNIGIEETTKRMLKIIRDKIGG